jgi:hypothetical protein
VFASLVVGGALLGTRWGVDGVAIAVSIAILLTFLLNAKVANRLIDVTFFSFARAHAHGALLATFILVVLIAGERFVWYDVGVVWHFPIEAAVTGVIIYATCFVRPRWFIGEDGIWLLGELRRRAPSKLRGLVPAVRG